MKVQDLFVKDIYRKIDGVVKADQDDISVLTRELEEFVVTAEVRNRMSQLFGTIHDSIQSPDDPTNAGSTGVWISGFFGSGKSMLLKILSLIIENSPITLESGTAFPADIVLPKFSGDPLTQAQMEKCCRAGIESVRFNIDSRADSSKGDSAVVDVFFRVFNAHRGRCEQNPHVAEFEDILQSKGQLEDFKHQFENRTGKKWGDLSARYAFYSTEVIESLQAVSGCTPAEAQEQFNNISNLTSITPDHFATKVHQYLSEKGPDARIMFFADEIGQFIGQNGRLMLSLQTITEELGVKTKGRAWVFVTAQEDLESVIGQLGSHKANDFSKIQGRFATKLKLSSSNADEVIQKRLLEKTEEAKATLAPIYKKLNDILRNAISFPNAGITFPKLGDEEDFSIEYPFLPYQFQLVPKIYTAIRQRGATGQHLAEGERSMLSAFQICAKEVAGKDVGVLVPAHLFFETVEGHLEGPVIRAISDAKNKPGFTDFDVNLLKTLFLIRWVEPVKGNIETLVTLSLTHMDEDRASLKAAVEESLLKLEKDTLISRSGENYYFLTNEEQAVDRQIQAVSLQPGHESIFIGKTIFEDVLTNSSKFRYLKNGKDFSLARICDGRPVGASQNPELEIRVISPSDPDYSQFESESKGIMASKSDQCVICVLPDDKELAKEILTLLQVEKFLTTSQSVDDPRETKQIHAERGRENDERRKRVIAALSKAFADSKLFIDGQVHLPKASEAKAIFEECMETLIDKSFNQLGLIKRLSTNALVELKPILRFNDVEKQLVSIESSDNRDAINAVDQRIEILASQHSQIVVSDLVVHYGKRPFGWPEYEVILIIGRLIAASKILLKQDGGIVIPDDAYEPLSKPGKWKQLIVERKAAIGAEDLQRARILAQQLFHGAVSNVGEEAARYIRTELTTWNTRLTSAKSYADQVDRYPGKETIDKATHKIQAILDDQDSNRLITGFLAESAFLTDNQKSISQVLDFYNSQRPAWDKLLAVYESCRPNESAIRNHDEAAATALHELRKIISDPEPYGRIPEANKLAAQIATANEEALNHERQLASQAILEIQESLDKETKNLSEEKAKEVQAPLRYLRESIAQESLASNLNQVRERAATIYNTIVNELTQSKEPDTPPLTIKPIRTVKPTAKTLETPEEVDAYLSDLKTEILNIIQKGEKVQVQ